MAQQAAAKIGETRHSDWVAFGHYGLSAYRIWMTRADHGMRQRHEWKRDDGSVKLDDWIPTRAATFPDHWKAAPEVHTSMARVA